MRAIRVSAYGGVEVMRPEELPTPSPGPGQARVKGEAVGVNFIDIYQRSGLYPQKLPFTLGLEGAGVIEAVGSGVSELGPGDHVAWASVPGSYATHVLAPLERLVRLPEKLSFAQGAAAMLQGMTAHYLCHATFPLHPGDSCLVHAPHPRSAASRGRRASSCLRASSWRMARLRRMKRCPAAAGHAPVAHRTS